jgi:hypothetical protein
MWGSYPATLRKVGGCTQVPVCVWNIARKGTWVLPRPVKLERRDMTYTVSMWRKTQNKQTIYIYIYNFLINQTDVLNPVINSLHCNLLCLLICARSYFRSSGRKRKTRKYDYVAISCFLLRWAPDEITKSRKCGKKDKLITVSSLRVFAFRM